jgi:DNA-binding transcriptional regulator WhiA
MSFTQKIKHEILEHEMNREQATALLTGIIDASGVFDLNEIIIKLNKSNISDIIRNILKQLKIINSISSNNKN